MTALACLAYLAWRFESVTVPAGIDPALGLAPGERLILDRRPTAVQDGDFVVHVDAGGLRHFARIVRAAVAGAAPRVHEAVGAGAATVLVDQAAIEARVILVWSN